MVARKVLAGFAMLALGAAIVSPVATASSRCGRKACSDEAASGISGQAREACLRQVIADWGTSRSLLNAGERRLR